jgi:hypothetical protein
VSIIDKRVSKLRDSGIEPGLVGQDEADAR